MSKRELIDRIRLLNPTARSSFLAQFNEPDLIQYLEHLEATTAPIARAFTPPVGPSVFAPEADPRQLALSF